MEFLFEALKDTVNLIPFLIITFIVIEYFEHKFGKKFDSKIRNAGKFGPIIGAVLGIIPQCGFSVIAVAFYTEGFLTLGTLIAVFVATSDEAIPVLLSTPGAFSKVIPFIATKFVFAIFWGYIIDLFYKNKMQSARAAEEASETEYLEDECIDKPVNLKNIIYHSLKRALKITVYVFAINVIISGVLHVTSLQALRGLMNKHAFIQIIVASIVGLIPNCAVSVGLVQFYLIGVLSFPSIIAGLSSNAGLALLVLYKDIDKKKNVLIIISVLLACSIMTGLILLLI